MEKKKNVIAGSIIAGAIIAVSGFTANAAGLFHYSNLGTGEAVRTSLLNHESSSRNFELKCGEKKKSDTTMTKKGKDGKCGEGKCGDMKKKGEKKKDKKGM